MKIKIPLAFSIVTNLVVIGCTQFTLWHWVKYCGLSTEFAFASVAVSLVISSVVSIFVMIEN